MSEIKNIRATVLICTMRPEPRLELTLQCLKNQTHKNLELIYVDSLKDSRPKKFLNLIKKTQKDFPILHIKDQPRPRLGIYPGIANARNTGLLFATGETIIFSGDNTYFQEFWVERHILAYSKGLNSVSPRLIFKQEFEDLSGYPRGEMIKHPEHPAKVYAKFGDKQYESPMDGKVMHLPEEMTFNKEMWIFCPGGFMHAMSVQYSLDRLLNVNGWDERYDKDGYGFEDCDLGFRMFYMGFPNELSSDNAHVLDTGNWVVQFWNKTKQRLVPLEEGKPNKVLYDRRAETIIPIWANPNKNLRKMRKKIWKRGNKK